jgi:hypothetical protein
MTRADRRVADGIHAVGDPPGAVPGCAAPEPGAD